MKVGLIGCGAMGSAIVRGAVAAKKLAPENLVVTDVYKPAAQFLSAELGAQQLPGAAEVVGAADLVILAVKPHHQSALLGEIAPLLKDHRCILVSIAAGRNTADIEADLAGYDAPVVRVMPNVCASIGQSMSGVCAGSKATESDLETVVELFAAVGGTTVIAEELFSAYSALAGCAPAWVFRFIDALAQAGVAHGIPKAQATKIAAQTLVGSGALVLDALEKQRVTQQLVDQVCSPGGTTVAGLLAMEEAGFSVAATAAVDAAVARDKELSAD